MLDLNPRAYKAQMGAQSGQAWQFLKNKLLSLSLLSATHGPHVDGEQSTTGPAIGGVAKNS